MESRFFNPFQMNIEELIDYDTSLSLSDSELEMICPGVRVVAYDELDSFNDIDELLSPNGMVIVLYQQTKYYGHWCAICWEYCRDRDCKKSDCRKSDCRKSDCRKIGFFDPLGCPPDSLFDSGSSRHNRSPHLSRLFLESDYEILYNPSPLQRDASNIATCGKWCAVRCLLRSIPLARFISLFSDLTIDADWLVSALCYVSLLQS